MYYVVHVKNTPSDCLARAAPPRPLPRHVQLALGGLVDDAREREARERVVVARAERGGRVELFEPEQQRRLAKTVEEPVSFSHFLGWEISRAFRRIQLYL